MLFESEQQCRKLSTAQQPEPRFKTFSDPIAHLDPIFIRFAILEVQDQHKLQLCNFAFTWRQQSTPAKFLLYFT